MWELQLWNFLLPIPISICNTEIKNHRSSSHIFSFTVKYRFVRVPTD
ncbi:hypothetical protein LEP1GSC112_3561 [Leptospira interrogans serovar Pomona str. UT364]|nr:hypothetical protein LEP1GSC112_3561 [Leptospira interrogans serovar Pomona str. UT364]